MRRIKYKIRRIWDIVRYEFPNYLRNLKRFRKGLWHFRWYDRHGIFVLLNDGLTVMADKTERYGIEIDETRLKKVTKMRRAAELLQNFVEENFVEQAEAEIGALIMKKIEFTPSETHPGSYELVDNDTPEEKKHNRSIFNRAHEIEAEQWNELMEILKGQDLKKFKPGKTDWLDWYDGSGLQNWWD
jgi:hypothetical protein